MLWPQDNSQIMLRGNVKLSNDATDIMNTYLQWSAGASHSRMEIDHGFAADGLLKMAGALTALTSSVSMEVGRESKPRIDVIKNMSDLIVQDSKSLEHAEMVKEAFTAAKEVLALVQTHSFPKLKEEIEILDQKASAVHTDKLMLEQKAEIFEVYRQVAVILTLMTDDKS